MGTWGPGNFDNDAALDFVERVADVVREELVPPTEFEEIALVMAAVAVYRVLVEQCCAHPAEPAEVRALRDETLRVFDEEKDEFTVESNEEHMVESRRRIEATFEAFLRLCEEDVSGAGG